MLLGLMAFSVILSWLIDVQLRTTLVRWAEQEAMNLATRAIALAVTDVTAQRISSTALVHTITDSRGNLISLQYEWGEINRLMSATTFKVHEMLRSVQEREIWVPIGQVTGLQFLSGWGPRIPVRILPVGSVDTTPVSEFVEAGINQTLHRINLQVKTRVRVVVPLVSRDVEVASSFTVAENVLLGQVPQVYLRMSGQPISPGAQDPSSAAQIGALVGAVAGAGAGGGAAQPGGSPPGRWR